MGCVSGMPVSVELSVDFVVAWCKCWGDNIACSFFKNMWRLTPVVCD